jgi:hypothetical protein
MSLQLQGIEGEQLARRILRDIFKQNNLQQLDWIVKWQNRKWYVVEAKRKELFTAGANFPHDGTGLGIRQIELRKELLEDLNLDTILLTITADAVYLGMLSKLEALPADQKYDTGGIRIYAIENFTKIENFKAMLKDKLNN